MGKLKSPGGLSEIFCNSIAAATESLHTPFAAFAIAVARRTDENINIPIAVDIPGRCDRKTEIGIRFFTIGGPVGRGPQAGAAAVENKNTPFVGDAAIKIRDNHNHIILPITINISCRNLDIAHLRSGVVAFCVPTGAGGERIHGDRVGCIVCLDDQA